MGPTFVAIDFETADSGADSACAVGLVRVEDGRIVERASRLIRPPRPVMEFAWVHGLTWDMVKGAGRFGEVWTEMAPLIRGAEFLAAHNAPFDRAVLHAGCRSAGIEPPSMRFECTVRLARRVFGIYPTKLPNVCRALGIELRHHDAASDAEACARIVIAALEEAGGGTLRGDGGEVDGASGSPGGEVSGP